MITINTKLLQVLTKLQSELDIESFEVENLGANEHVIKFTFKIDDFDIVYQESEHGLDERECFVPTFESFPDVDVDSLEFYSIEELIAAIKAR